MPDPEQIKQAVRTSAFEYPDSVIHAFAGGSHLYGTATENSDLDIYGVFVEPKTSIFGLDLYEHFQSKNDNTKRNDKDDIDVKLYSLRRWTELAAKGDPTCLGFMFAKGCNPHLGWDWYVNEARPLLVAKSAVNRYKGFVTAQMARLLGEKGRGKHGQRPELEQIHGYDTKAAAHAVRLVEEGIELMQTYQITYPRPNVDRLLEIRRGDLSLDKLWSLVSFMLQELDKATATSKLPEKPDRKKLNKLLIETHEAFYAHERFYRRDK